MKQTYGYRVFTKSTVDNRNYQVAIIKLAVELKMEHQRPVLSISAAYKTRNGKELGGQCLDEIISDYPGLQHTEFGFWYKMWKLYHLNNMHAGTQKQEDVLKKAKESGVLPTNANYDLCCQYLKNVGLYEVTYHNKPYRYGSSWLYRSIYKPDLDTIVNLLNQGSKEKSLTI